MTLQCRITCQQHRTRLHTGCSLWNTAAFSRSCCVCHCHFVTYNVKYMRCSWLQEQTRSISETSFCRFIRILVCEGSKTEEVSRQRWETQIADCKDFISTAYSEVCSDHFVEDKAYHFCANNFGSWFDFFSFSLLMGFGCCSPVIFIHFWCDDF